MDESGNRETGGKRSATAGALLCRVFNLSSLCAVLLAGAVAALYARTARFGFLRLDDWGYTAGCPFVIGGLSWANAGEAFSRITYGGIWMPLTYISYAADITLFGGGWGVHHAVNAALHAINAILVFRFILSFMPKGERRGEGKTFDFATMAAFFAALLWAVHPQRVEAVAWIASRKEELWTMFALLGLMAWKGRRFRLGTLCCLLACLSKPTAVCFPLLAFLVEAVFLRFDAEREAVRKITAVTHFAQVKTICAMVFFRYFVLCLIALVAGLAAIGAQTNPEGMAEVQVLHVPFAERCVSFVVNLGLSLMQTVFPRGIHFDYMGTPVLGFLSGLLAMASELAMLALLFAHSRSRRFFVFCVAFFLLAFLPVSGLLGAFGEAARADRFLYMPSVAIALALAAFLSRPGKIRLCVAAALPVVFAAAAWPVVSSYRNDYAAFARALEFEPCNWRALQHVGSEYCAHLGKMDEGIELMRESYRISPRDSTAEVLAYSLACRGRETDAGEIFRLASKFVRFPQRDRRGMFAESLGIASLMMKRWGDAEKYFAASIAAPERFYSDTEARFRLAETYAGAGKPGEARKILRPLAIAEDREVRRRALSALDALPQ